MVKKLTWTFVNIEKIEDQWRVPSILRGQEIRFFASEIDALLYAESQAEIYNDTNSFGYRKVPILNSAFYTAINARVEIGNKALARLELPSTLNLMNVYNILRLRDNNGRTFLFGKVCWNGKTASVRSKNRYDNPTFALSRMVFTNMDVIGLKKQFNYPTLDQKSSPNSSDREDSGDDSPDSPLSVKLGAINFGQYTINANLRNIWTAAVQSPPTFPSCFLREDDLDNE